MPFGAERRGPVQGNERRGKQSRPGDETEEVVEEAAEEINDDDDRGDYK